MLLKSLFLTDTRIYSVVGTQKYDIKIDIFCAFHTYGQQLNQRSYPHVFLISNAL